MLRLLPFHVSKLFSCWKTVNRVISFVSQNTLQIDAHWVMTWYHILITSYDLWVNATSQYLKSNHCCYCQFIENLNELIKPKTLLRRVAKISKYMFQPHLIYWAFCVQFWSSSGPAWHVGLLTTMSCDVALLDLCICVRYMTCPSFYHIPRIRRIGGCYGFTSKPPAARHPPPAARNGVNAITQKPRDGLFSNLVSTLVVIVCWPD